MEVIWMLFMMLGFDLYKYFLRGAVKALALQKSVSCINLFGYWVLNFTMIWLFAFHLKLKVAGLWVAKAILEIYICLAYKFLICRTDWNQVILDSK